MHAAGATRSRRPAPPASPSTRRSGRPDRPPPRHPHRHRPPVDLVRLTAYAPPSPVRRPAAPPSSTTFNVLNTLGATGCPQVIHNLCTAGGRAPRPDGRQTYRSLVRRG